MLVLIYYAQQPFNDLQGVNDLFMSRGPAFFKFQMELVRYTSIVSPLARSIWSLEASQANAADVFIFWLAIGATLKQLFSRPESETGISIGLAQKVTASINSRYKAFIDGSATDAYFTAFFLDPRMKADPSSFLVLKFAHCRLFAL